MVIIITFYVVPYDTQRSQKHERINNLFSVVCGTFMNVGSNKKTAPTASTTGKTPNVCIMQTMLARAKIRKRVIATIAPAATTAATPRAITSTTLSINGDSTISSTSEAFMLNER